MSNAGALDRLVTLAFLGASGELVSTFQHDGSATGEVHVFLQRGRVAWVTSTARRGRLFAALSQLGIDRDVLQEVLAECQRTREPFGTTLVAWGLASLDDVRAALAEHAREAIEPLLGQPRARWVFLERTEAFESYDARLTFSLEELVPRLSSPRLTPHVPIQRGVDERIGRILPAGSKVIVEPASGRTRLLGRMESDFVAVRSVASLVVGMTLEEGGAVWIEAGAGTTMVQVMKALTESVRSPVVGPEPARAVGVTERPFDPSDPDAAGILERWEEIEAVAIAPMSGPATAASRGGLSPQQLRLLARSFHPLPRAEAWGLGGSEPCSIVLGRGNLWIFAVPVPAHRYDLWLVTRRARPQALGWSILGALSRAPSPPR